MDELKNNEEISKISKWLKKVKFKRKFIGGVDEQDVWKKINELNTLYNNALIAERARYNALLSQEDKND